MRSRLDRVTDWEQRLQNARWQAQRLARACGVGEWTLRHYVRERFGLRLHAWITKERMSEASDLLAQGLTVKEVAWAVGYKQPSHFSREFKVFHGVGPSEFYPGQFPERGDHRIR